MRLTGRQGAYVKRRLFTVASALSLLLCAASMVLWVRSMHRWDRAFLAGRFGRCEVMSELGFFDVSLGPTHELDRPVFLRSDRLSEEEQRGFSILRPTVIEFYDLPSVSCRGVKVSYRAAVLVLFLLPLGWVAMKFRRYRRGTLTLCLCCG